MGLDGRLSAVLRHPLLVARPAPAPSEWGLGRPVLAGFGMLALGLTAYALAHVRDWSAGGSVHDPAMILAILAMMTAGWAVLAYLRTADWHRVPTTNASTSRRSPSSILRRETATLET